MEIGGYKIDFSTGLIPTVTNLDVSKPKQSELITRITQTNLTRGAQDINRWRTAHRQAENKVNPKRKGLLEIYQDVVLDLHLTAQIETRKNKVLSRGFKLTDQANKVNDDAAKLLAAPWFDKWVSLVLDARYYGFTLIEFGAILEDRYSSVTSVPREYVIPEQRAFSLTIQQSEAIPFDVPPISNWVMFIGDETDLGLLNKATPLVLWKRLITAVWTEYNELYGVPIRIGKTRKTDEKTKAELEDMLRNMGRNAWGLFHEDDNIEIISGIKVGGQGTYKDFLNFANEELSKLIVGQTMSSEDGASLSQAQVHERILESFTGADLRWVANVINSQLLPFMEAHGFPVAGLTFAWDLEERLSLLDRWTIDEGLINSGKYKVSAEVLKTTYGVEVEEVEAPAIPGAIGSVMPAVYNLYEPFLK